MKILNRDITDLSKRIELYQTARDLMQKNQLAWPDLPEELITQEIKDYKQWMLLINEDIDL